MELGDFSNWPPGRALCKVGILPSVGVAAAGGMTEIGDFEPYAGQTIRSDDRS